MVAEQMEWSRFRDELAPANRTAARRSPPGTQQRRPETRRRGARTAGEQARRRGAERRAWREFGRRSRRVLASRVRRRGRGSRP